MKKRLSFILLILFGLTISIPAILPLFREGFFIVHDNTQVERVFEMTNSLTDGHFPVRWVENLGYGYGYPIYNFYAPFPYYVGGFINLLVNNSLIATKIVFGIGIISSFFSVYYLASRLTNSLGGITAGVLYLYFPYHAVNIYVRGAVGEFFAYIFTPLALLGIYKIYKRVKKQKFPLLHSAIWAIPLALLVISHNLSAYMAALFLIPYVLFLFFKTQYKKMFAYSIGILLIISFFLSAFYVVPAALESGFTNVESQTGGGADYQDHFICLSQLWQSNWGFGGSIPGCIDGLSFSLGKLNVVLLAAAFLYFVYSIFRKRKFFDEIIYWLLFAFSIFLTLSYSKFIWDALPLMEFLQYPWRFLNFAGLFTSILGAFLVFKIRDARVAVSVVIIIVLATIYTNYGLFSPVGFENNSNAYYEDLEHLRFETSKISDEYMPPGFDKPSSESELVSQLLEIENASASAILLNGKTGYYEFTKQGEAAEIHINKAYFPSWEANINDEEIEINERPEGMSIDVPEGEQNIILRIKSTFIQSLGNTMTIIGIIAVFAVIIAKRNHFYEKN